ncbi:MAG: hypothetical protein ACJAUF_000817, partial [Bacteroidia bacterium]
QYEYRIARQCDLVDSIEEQVYAYEKIGIKATGTAGFDSATEWLINRYRALGYSPIVDTFLVGEDTSYNVIVEKPGSEPNKWIIVGAHFDSVDEGPGANDNGSGVIATLEIARLIKDVDTKIGVRIVNFGAEENGLVGSRHYVANTLADETEEEIQLMINLDQIGGAITSNNSTIVCERDEDDSPFSNNEMSSLKTDTLGRLVYLYTTISPILGRAERSDYVPFEDVGLVVTGLYQNTPNPHYHNATDITANIDIPALKEVIKGAVAATLYFSRIQGVVGVEKLDRNQVNLLPLPAASHFSISTPIAGPLEVTLINSYGVEVLVQQTEGMEPISVTHLASGVYTVKIYSEANLSYTLSKLIIAR